MYLEDHKIHAEMMFLVAMTAVTRKIVPVIEERMTTALYAYERCHKTALF